MSIETSDHQNEAKSYDNESEDESDDESLSSFENEHLALLSDPTSFRSHFIKTHAKLKSAKDSITPSSVVQAFIDQILKAGSFYCSTPPSSQEEVRLVLAFINACVDVRPYLGYLPLLSPWENVGSIVDRIFLSEKPFGGQSSHEL